MEAREGSTEAREGWVEAQEGSVEAEEAREGSVFYVIFFIYFNITTLS